MSKAILRAFGDRVIAYNRIYAHITGSVTAGLLLSQLMYWNSAMKGNEFYKTNDDLCEELCMGTKELKNAKAELVALGIVTVTLKSIPAKSYYQVNEDRIIDLINAHEASIHQDGPKRPNWIDRNGPSTTENNTENINKYDFSKNSKEEELEAPPSDEPTLTETAREIASGVGLLPEMTRIQFDKFLDYNQRKGVSLTNWLGKWDQWCRKAVEYKPELRYVAPVENSLSSKKYGTYPVPSGFLANYAPVEDNQGNRICMVYWNSAEGYWAQTDGTVWEFQDEKWYKKE